MGRVRQNDTGLIHYEPGRALRGYTLFCGGGDAYLIDMDGRICHRWQHELGIQYGSLLPGGRLLCRRLAHWHPASIDASHA